MKLSIFIVALLSFLFACLSEDISPFQDSSEIITNHKYGATDYSNILDSQHQLDAAIDHKPLYPMNNSDYFGIALICVGLMIAASGGIGGGGIVVPLLILILGFQPKHAIALSNFTILGSSVTNMVLNLSKVHPHAKRPLVDWDLILVMEPLTMAGAVCICTKLF